MKSYIPFRRFMTGIGILFYGGQTLQAQQELSYHASSEINVSSGTYAPLWFTANKYGLSGVRPKSAFVRTGVEYEKEWTKNWQLKAGIDLAVAKNQVSQFVVQQAYADLSWKELTLSIGSKERSGYPLEKDMSISSGMMVEGSNARPVPQIRFDIKNYITVPHTRKWLGVRGHIAYGIFTDANWQKHFVPESHPEKGQYYLYTEKVWYHSKSLMFRIGNKEVFPMEFELGILDAAQFGGNQMYRLSDGTSVKNKDMSKGFSAFLNAFIPKHGGTLQNVSGNHCGSWNFALTGYINNWKIRTYLEHYYEDHSQMFWQYGRWKDGQIGVEVTLPENRWLTAALYEGINTTDQTGPILYDAPAGSFSEIQQSGGDNYFNNGEYLGWQHFGQTMGLSLIPGPQYNADHQNRINSSRIRANHFGFRGTPFKEWSWRMLFSSVRHYGTYIYPLDKVRKQFSSLYEVTFSPKRFTGWSAKASLGLDRGNYLGNSTGFMFTISKSGYLFNK